MYIAIKHLHLSILILPRDKRNRNTTHMIFLSEVQACSAHVIHSVNSMRSNLKQHKLLMTSHISDSTES